MQAIINGTCHPGEPLNIDQYDELCRKNRYDIDHLKINIQQRVTELTSTEQQLSEKPLSKDSIGKSRQKESGPTFVGWCKSHQCKVLFHRPQLHIHLPFSGRLTEIIVIIDEDPLALGNKSILSDEKLLRWVARPA